MRNISYVLERWGAWAANEEVNVGWSHIGAGFKGLLPQERKSREPCCDEDGLVIDGCINRLRKNNNDLYELLILYYIYRLTFMQLAKKYKCSDGNIGKRLQRAEGVIDGMLMMLDVRLEMDGKAERKGTT